MKRHSLTIVWMYPWGMHTTVWRYRWRWVAVMTMWAVLSRLPPTPFGIPMHVTVSKP